MERIDFIKQYAPGYVYRPLVRINKTRKGAKTMNQNKKLPNVLQQCQDWISTAYDHCPQLVEEIEQKIGFQFPVLVDLLNPLPSNQVEEVIALLELLDGWGIIFTDEDLAKQRLKELRFDKKQYGALALVTDA